MEGGDDVNILLSQNKQQQKPLDLLTQDLHLRELYCPEVLMLLIEERTDLRFQMTQIYVNFGLPQVHFI